MSQYTGNASLLSVWKKIKLISLVILTKPYLKQSSSTDCPVIDLLVYPVNLAALQVSVDDLFSFSPLDRSLTMHWVSITSITKKTHKRFLPFLFVLSLNLKTCSREWSEISEKTYQSRWYNKLHQLFVLRCPGCLYTKNLDCPLSRVVLHIAEVYSHCHHTGAIFRQPALTHRHSW